MPIIPQPGGGALQGGGGVFTPDPLDALQAAIDSALPSTSPERAAFDTVIGAIKASPEAATVRTALASMCQSLAPAPQPPSPPGPNPTPAPAASTGVSTGAAVGIGAGGLVLGAALGYMAKGMKR